MNKEFKAFNHGINAMNIKIGAGSIFTELRPTEIHLKEDGTITDEPSFGIMLVDGIGDFYLGQISLKMFNEGVEEIGYKLVKI